MGKKKKETNKFEWEKPLKPLAETEGLEPVRLCSTLQEEYLHSKQILPQAQLPKQFCCSHRNFCPAFKQQTSVTLHRNYWKSKVKYDWLSGKYSNIQSRSNLPEKCMYPMDVDTWGEILEAELERVLYRGN
ncbi:F-box only protein 48 isoform X2 [Crotalus tigris]|uniref:F-box only protein 48 isoform X2 n=1 Tax=Crotalus tigris TaxID=88082 RepID=UPI00192FA743|nr:F-box only protein 48 isoform X2 [Crotalus tigris]